jgi:uncharacterized protein YggE
MANQISTFLLLIALLTLAASLDYQCTANTFTVIGNGQVSFTPDIVQVTISATGNGTTAAAALNRLNTQINTVLRAFSTLNIPSSNYSTSAININQIYNYSNSPVTLLGSEATQSLRLTLGNPPLLNTLLTNLASVNVTVSSMVFDLFDQSTALQRARAAAFLDARNKFNQYLQLTSLRSDGLKKISDLNSELITPFRTDADSFALFSRFTRPITPVQIAASVSATWKVRP